MIKACEAWYLEGLADTGTSAAEDQRARGAALGVYACRLLRGLDSIDSIRRGIAKRSGDAAAAARVATWLRAQAADVRAWIKVGRPKTLVR